MYVFYINENKINLSVNNKSINPIQIEVLKFQDKNQFNSELNSLKNKNSKYLLLNVENIDNSLSGIISNLKRKYNNLVATGKNTKIIRFLIESTQIDYILDPQKEQTIDTTHNFKSGLNQVIVDLLKEKEKKVLFSINDFMFYDKVDNRKIGKIQQNMTILDKKEVDYTFIQFIEPNKEIIEIKNIIPFFNMKYKKKVETQKILENSKD